MLQRASEAVARIMALARSLGGVISGEHGIGITKLEYLEPDGARGRSAPTSARSIPKGRFNAGKLLAGARPRQRLHAELRAHRRRVADPRADRPRPRRRCDQGLPALRQVQAAVRHPRAARQPALLAAQQDPRHLAPHRGDPLRGADAPRRRARALRRVRRRRRPLHRVPQVRARLPGGHRLRRRLDRHAQPTCAARASAASTRARGLRCCSSTLTDPRAVKMVRTADDRLGLPRAARRLPVARRPSCSSADRAAAARRPAGSRRCARR